MDDIEIVIKISEKEYDAIKENKYGVFSGHIFETIRNGRPLSEYCPVIHHKKPITKEDIDDCIRRSDIGLTDFEIVMCNGNYKEALKMLLTKIEKAQPVIPKSAWIPVTEKSAPEEGGTYLVTVHNERRFMSGYGSVSAYYNKRDNQWVSDDEWVDGDVVAWMPLPEPYKPESEEKKE